MVSDNRKFRTAKTSSVSPMIKTVLVSGQFVLLCLAFCISYCHSWYIHRLLCLDLETHWLHLSKVTRNTILKNQSKSFTIFMSVKAISSVLHALIWQYMPLKSGFD